MRMRGRLAAVVRRQIGSATPSPAVTATGATAAPAPIPAPRIHVGGEPARNNTDSARINTKPGKMKPSPPISAPPVPRSRHAQ